MPSNLDSGIQSIVTRAAAEVARLVRQSIAEEVERVVGGGTRAPSARGRAKAAAPESASGRRGRRRGLGESDLEAVYGFIGKNPGLRSEEIQKQLGGNAETVRKALAKLRASGRAKTKGAKRATTYFAV